jgi:hypothetical protein
LLSWARAIQRPPVSAFGDCRCWLLTEASEAVGFEIGSSSGEDEARRGPASVLSFCRRWHLRLNPRGWWTEHWCDLSVRHVRGDRHLEQVALHHDFFPAPRCLPGRVSGDIDRAERGQVDHKPRSECPTGLPIRTYRAAHSSTARKPCADLCHARSVSRPERGHARRWTIAVASTCQTDAATPLGFDVRRPFVGVVEVPRRRGATRRRGGRRKARGRRDSRR